MPNEHAIYSVEYGKITHKRIISRCRRVFGAEDDKIYRVIDDKPVQFRALRFNKTTIDQQGKAYEIIDSIKIVDDDMDSDSDSDSDSSPGSGPGPDSGYKTERRKYAHNMNTSKNEERDLTDKRASVQNDPYNNNDSNDSNIDDIHDSSNDVINITTQEEEPKAATHDSTKDSTYTCTAQISVLQSCKTEAEGEEREGPKEETYTGCDCDVSTKEKADRFTAEVERLQKINRVAEAAEANLSGDGVVDKESIQTD